MNNPLLNKYTSVRKAKKAYKKALGKNFPRWYIYKKWFMRLVTAPCNPLPERWEWLRHSDMKESFEKSFARGYLYWDGEMIDKFFGQGLSLF